MAEDLGDLGVNITGDWSDLEAALGAAENAAQQAGGEIVSAFQQAAQATDLAGGSLNIFQSILAADEAAGRDLSQTLQDLAGSASTVGSAVADAAQKLIDEQTAAEGATTATQDLGSAAASSTSQVDQLGNSIQSAGSDAAQAQTGLEGMVEQFTLLGEALVITAGLKDFGEAALTAYGTIQSVDIGLTALTGSAQEADQIIGQIKALSDTEPFAFPEIAPTVQRMVALGVSAAQVNQVMLAAGDAAAATGNSFAQVANMIDRMSLSGMANARTMATLGISTTDLGNALGVTADQASKAFKALDQEDRINAITQALSKFAGTAEAEAQGIAGQWQLFENQFNEVMVSVGASIAPAIGQILKFGEQVFSTIGAVIQEFGLLPAPVQDIVIGIGLLAAAAVPATAALSALGLAVIGLQGIIPAVTGLVNAFTGANVQAAAAGATLGTTTTTTAAALVTEGEAASTAATETQAFGAAAATAGGEAGVGGLTVALGSAATAATGLVAILGGFAVGTWLAGLKDTSDQLSDLGHFATALGVNLGQASAGADGLASAVKKLNDIAAQNHITVQQGGDDMQTYALRILEALQAHQKLFGPLQDTYRAVQNGTGSIVAQDAAVTQLTAKVSSLKGALSDAQVTLILVKADYQLGAASADDVAAATEGVTKAQKDLDSELGIAVPKLESYKQAMKDMALNTVPSFADSIQAAANKIGAAITDENAVLTNQVGAWLSLSSNAASSSATIQAAWNAVIKSQTAAGASVDDLQGVINADLSKMGLSINDLIVNWQKMASSGDETAQQASADFKMIQLAAGGAGMTMSELVDSVDTYAAKFGGATAMFINGKIAIEGVGTAATDATAASDGLVGKFAVLTTETNTLTTAANGYVTVTDVATGNVTALTDRTQDLNQQLQDAQAGYSDASDAADIFANSQYTVDDSVIQVIQSTELLVNAGEDYLTSAGSITAANEALYASYNQVAAAAEAAAGAIGGASKASGGSGSSGNISLNEAAAGAAGFQGSINAQTGSQLPMEPAPGPGLWVLVNGQWIAAGGQGGNSATVSGGSSAVASAASSAASSTADLATAIGTDSSTGLTAALTTSASATATTTTASTSLASAVTDLGTASTVAATAVSTAAATVSNAAQATVATLAALGITVNGDGTFTTSGAATDTQLQAIGQYQSGLQGSGAGSVSVSGPTNINGQTSAETAASAAYQASLDPATGLPYRGTASTASIGQVYSSNGASAPSAAYLASIQNSIDPSTGLPYRGTPGAVSGTDLASVAPAWRSPSTNVFDSGALPNNPVSGTSNGAPITVNISGMTPSAANTVANQQVNMMRLAGLKVS